MAAQASLARFSGMSLASTAGIHLLGAVAGVLTARFLGPEGKGLLVVIMLWPGLLAAVGGGLGLEDALVYFTARDRDRHGAILATGALLACLQSGLLTVLGWSLMPLLLAAHPHAVTDARLYLVWILLTHLTLTAMSVLQGSMSFKALNLLRLVVATTTLAGLISLSVANLVSVHGVVILYLGAHMVSLVAAWTVVLRCYRSFGPDLRLVKPLISYAAKVQLGNIAAVANERIDLVLLSVLVASSQLGLYAAAMSLSAAVRVFGSSFALVTFPTLAKPGNEFDRRSGLCALTRATVWCSVVAGLALVLVAPAAFRILFGAAFVDGIVAAQVLLLATVALNAARVLSAGLKAMNLPAKSSVGEALGAVATVVGLLLLIPKLGLVGAALAGLLSYLVSLAYLAWTVRRHLAVRLHELVVPTRADLAALQAVSRGLVAKPSPATA